MVPTPVVRYNWQCSWGCVRCHMCLRSVLQLGHGPYPCSQIQLAVFMGGVRCHMGLRSVLQLGHGPYPCSQIQLAVFMGLCQLPYGPQICVTAWTWLLPLLSDTTGSVHGVMSAVIWASDLCYSLDMVPTPVVRYNWQCSWGYVSCHMGLRSVLQLGHGPYPCSQIQLAVFMGLCQLPYGPQICVTAWTWLLPLLSDTTGSVHGVMSAVILASDLCYSLDMVPTPVVRHNWQCSWGYVRCHMGLRSVLQLGHGPYPCCQIQLAVFMGLCQMPYGPQICVTAWTWSLPLLSDTTGSVHGVMSAAIWASDLCYSLDMVPTPVVRYNWQCSWGCVRCHMCLSSV